MHGRWSGNRPGGSVQARKPELPGDTAMPQITRIIEVAVAFVSVLNCAGGSEAEIINCQYTGPFLTTVYSTNTSTLTFTDAGDASKNKILRKHLLADHKAKSVRTLERQP